MFAVRTVTKDGVRIDNRRYKCEYIPDELIGCKMMFMTYPPHYYHITCWGFADKYQDRTNIRPCEAYDAIKDQLTLLGSFDKWQKWDYRGE